MVTILLMNYQRRKNIDLILDFLRSQNISLEIFLWNNADESFSDDRVDWVINSSNNTRCWSRWFIAQYATNDFIMTLDDDLMFEGNDSIDLLLHSAKVNYEKGRITGLFGVQYNGAKNYWAGPKERKSAAKNNQLLNVHVDLPDTTMNVDMVKGRCMVFNKADLNLLPMAPKFIDFGDDLIASYYMGAGHIRHHRITNVLSNRIVNLKEEKGEMALSSTGNWNDIRSEIMNHYWKSN
ncbi:MAG: hypothetical protein JXQ90_21495 [Cyclobacteriaceae bacterium]